jgi:hypothetical protein
VARILSDGLHVTSTGIFPPAPRGSVERRMFMRTIKIATIAALALSASTLAGCIDPYTGVPHGYYVARGEALTAEVVHHTDAEVAPRCKQYAKETNPTRGKAALAGGWNNGLAGLAGGGSGAKANAAITGARLAQHAALGIGVNGALFGGVSGAINGWVNVGAIRHNATEGCLAEDAGGLHAIAPSEARRVAAGGAPRTYDAGDTTPPPTSTGTPAKPKVRFIPTVR